MKITKALFIIGFSVTFVISWLVIIFGKPLLSIFLPGEQVAIDFGYMRLLCIMSIIAVYSLASIAWSVIRAYGKNVLQMFVNILGICGSRFIWMLVFYPMNPTPFVLYVNYPISYILVTGIAVFAMVRLLKKYKNNQLELS